MSEATALPEGVGVRAWGAGPRENRGPAPALARLRFWRDRATRNKWVYQEERERGVPAVIGVLYLDKDWLAAHGDPLTVEVSIAVPVQR